MLYNHYHNFCSPFFCSLSRVSFFSLLLQPCGCTKDSSRASCFLLHFLSNTLYIPHALSGAQLSEELFVASARSCGLSAAGNGCLAHTICALSYHSWVASLGRQTTVCEWKHESGIRTAKAEGPADYNLRGETAKQLHIHKKYGAVQDIKGQTPRNGFEKHSVALVLLRFKAFTGNVSSLSSHRLH